MASNPPVVVCPPTETGGRHVRIDGTILDTVYSLRDLTASSRAPAWRAGTSWTWPARR